MTAGEKNYEIMEQARRDLTPHQKVAFDSFLIGWFMSILPELIWQAAIDGARNHAKGLRI